MKKLSSWSNWYLETLKKNSKSKEEELERCKEMLKLFREILHDVINTKPMYIKELLELLEGVDETQIEDALCELLEMPFIFHMDSCIDLYIKWKDRLDFRKIDSALCALSNTVARFAVDEESMLGELKLDTLGGYLVLTDMISQGAISAVLQGNPFSSGILLRSALEAGLKGILFEHLLDRRFRAKVKRKSYIDKYYTDSVVRFLKDVENKSRDLGKPLEDVIRGPEALLVDYLRIKDVAWWLEEWNVFEPIHSATQLIVKRYDNLSQEVHGKMTALYHRSAVSTVALDKLMEEIIEIIDLILVGTLNTIKNLTHERLTKSNSERWKEFIRLVKSGGLEHTRKRLTAY